MNSLSGSKENIHDHYDIGNDFYRLWLDERMQYTCAYFPEPTTTLEEAQIAKMDHVCKKLMLRPGETVVEAGCGWGTLAMHMARHYGVKVKAYNISRQQVISARERAKAEGLDDQVEYYRGRLPEHIGQIRRLRVDRDAGTRGHPVLPGARQGHTALSEGRAGEGLSTP